MTAKEWIAPAVYALALALATGGAIAAPHPPQHAPARPGSPDTFNALRRRADQARTARRLDEAIELYARAVRLRRGWVEGHWYLGTIYYDLEKYAECRDAFGTVVRLQPKNGDAWAFKGLCEFRLTYYDSAIKDLNKAEDVGLEDPKLIPVARYHRAVLQARLGEYERALQTYAQFARAGNDTPAVIDAMGIAVLRLPVLPDQLPPDQREMVALAGRATFLAAANSAAMAENLFEELVRRYPKTPNVHYLYGVFLLRDRPDQALDEFDAELHISPNHALAMQQLAQESMKRGDLDAAMRWATQAVRIAPENFVGRRVLGQIKLEINDVAGAVAELETALTLQPDSPSVHYALARAYQRAGRTEDARRERAEFSRLEKLQRERRGGAAPTEPPK